MKDLMDMKSLSFTGLIKTFVFALIKFIINGWIGWVGIVFILLRIIGIIHWSWWMATLPLEYGAIYCLYMTIDGALYRAGFKGVGAYARYTSSVSQPESEILQIQTIIIEGPEYIGETIDRLCNVKSRLKFNQSLLDASLLHYSLPQLAILGNKNLNSKKTIKKWKESGLKFSEEWTL